MRKKPKTSEAMLKSQAKYHAEKTKLLSTRFLVAEDADVIEKLSSVPSRRRYLVDLVRADIAAHPDIEIQEDAE